MHRAAPPSASHAFSETCFLPVSSKTCTRASQCGRKNAICDARVHVFGSGRCRFSRCRFAQRRLRAMPLWLAPVRPAPVQGDAGSVQGQFGPMLDRTHVGSDQCRLRAASVRPVLAQGNAGFGRPNILSGPAHSPWFLRGMRALCVSSVRQRDRVKQSEYVHRGRFLGAAGVARRELPPVKREPHGIRLKTPFNRLR